MGGTLIGDLNALLRAVQRGNLGDGSPSPGFLECALLVANVSLLILLASPPPADELLDDSPLLSA